ncbi:MAG: tetratricopeptide repeat protein [Chitinivibrionales bacterium]|nr:tetratricopeptide repeat protein [Chitinivibrionales bacterium]
MHCSVIYCRKGLSTTAIILIGLVCAFFSLVSFFAVKHIFDTWSPTLSNSQQLFKDKKYDQALALAQKLRRSGKTDSELLTLVGKTWMAKAWKRQEKENWRNYGNDVDDWLQCPEAQNAQEALEKALELNPDNVEAHYYAGRLYLEKGWFYKAESQYLETLRLQKDYVPAYIDLAALYVKTNNYDHAESELKKAYAHEPENPSVSKNLYVLYQHYKEMPESAMVWANRYLNRNPGGDLDKYFIRENLEQMLERYPEVTLPDSRNWKQERRFKPTERFGGK